MIGQDELREKVKARISSEGSTPTSFAHSAGLSSHMSFFRWFRGESNLTDFNQKKVEAFLANEVINSWRDMPLTKEIVDALNQWRKEQSLQIKEMAVLAELYRSTMGEILNGKAGRLVANSRRKLWEMTKLDCIAMDALKSGVVQDKLVEGVQVEEKKILSMPVQRVKDSLIQALFNLISTTSPILMHFIETSTVGQRNALRELLGNGILDDLLDSANAIFTEEARNLVLTERAQRTNKKNQKGGS